MADRIVTRNFLRKTNDLSEQTKEKTFETSSCSLFEDEYVNKNLNKKRTRERPSVSLYSENNSEIYKKKSRSKATKNTSNSMDISKEDVSNSKLIEKNLCESKNYYNLFQISNLGKNLINDEKIIVSEVKILEKNQEIKRSNLEKKILRSTVDEIFSDLEEMDIPSLY
tara:strand:+ start:311 stop:814 length:504 start_codon:yes stop_codon:yes gene_type:complete